MKQNEHIKRKTKLTQTLFELGTAVRNLNYHEFSKFSPDFNIPLPILENIKQSLAEDFESKVTSEFVGSLCCDFIKDSDLKKTLKRALVLNDAVKNLLFTDITENLKEKLEILKALVHVVGKEFASNKLDELRKEKQNEDSLTSKTRQTCYDLLFELPLLVNQIYIASYLASEDEASKRAIWETIRQLTLMFYKYAKLQTREEDGNGSKDLIWSKLLGFLLFLHNTYKDNFKEGQLIEDKEIQNLLLASSSQRGLVQKEALFAAYCLSSSQNKELAFEIQLNETASRFGVKKDVSLKQTLNDFIQFEEFVSPEWLSEYIDSLFNLKTSENGMSLVISENDIKKIGKHQ